MPLQMVTVRSRLNGLTARAKRATSSLIRRNLSWVNALTWLAAGGG
jgi:hypothetical protein